MYLHGQRIDIGQIDAHGRRIDIGQLDVLTWPENRYRTDWCTYMARE